MGLTHETRKALESCPSRDEYPQKPNGTGRTSRWAGSVPAKTRSGGNSARKSGPSFVEGGFWKGSKVQSHVGPWTITLDTYTESSGESSTTYTRMRAPYVNPEGFRFTIYRKGPFSGLGKLLGMQDIEVGDPEFDEAFIIKGNDESMVRDSSPAPRSAR